MYIAIFDDKSIFRDGKIGRGVSVYADREHLLSVLRRDGEWGNRPFARFTTYKFNLDSELLVDDDAQFRELAARCEKQFGFLNVDYFTGGGSAISRSSLGLPFNRFVQDFDYLK